MLRTAQSLPQEWAFDTGLRPRPFPDEAASLLPGPLAATRTGLTPASDDELTTQDQPPTRSTSCLLGARQSLTDPIAELIDAATETFRASMHIPAVPEYPSDLYRRSGNLVDLLGKLAQVVGRLDDTLKHLPQTWELDSDDSSPAGTHVTTASFTLRATGAALDDAFRHANEAHSALLHLKLR